MQDTVTSVKEKTPWTRRGRQFVATVRGPGKRSPVPTIVFFLTAVGAIGAIVVVYPRLGLPTNFLFSSIALFLGILFLAEFIWDHLCASNRWMTADPWFPVPSWLAGTVRLWPLGVFLLGVLGGHRWWW